MSAENTIDNTDAFLVGLNPGHVALTIARLTKKHATEQIEAMDAIDTGATQASVYVEATTSTGEVISEYQEAVAKGTEAAKNIGRHSGRSRQFSEAVNMEGPLGPNEARCGVASDTGIIVELGTSKVPGRPFLSNALEIALSEYLTGSE